MATGDCYRAALDALLFEGESWQLVHGYPLGTGGEAAGVRFGHAWIERDGIVIDRANGRDGVLPRGLYYRVGRIREEDCVRYSLDEARREMLATEHCGPWHEEVGGDGDDD